MRVRFFTVVTALALALAVVAAFGTGAGARTGVSPKAVHKGKAAKVFVKPNAALVSLWNQNNNDSGVGIVSQNFETANDIYDSQGADDVKVKAGHVWKVKEVDVTGVYFNGSGLATSENVTFYKDAGGLPGAVKKSYTGLVGADNGLGSVVITLPTVTKLVAGKYWVSVQVNMDFSVGGEWGWETRTLQKASAAAWQNPGDGFASGCTTYANMQACIGDVGEGPDYMFALKGTTT